MRISWAVAIVATLIVTGSVAAQPNRQFPGGRVFLPGSPITPPTVPNSRTRPAASAVGRESTDFYPKNGYPKVLGDAVEQGSTSGQAGGAAAAGAAGGVAGGVSGGVSGGGVSGGVSGGIGGGGGVGGGGGGVVGLLPNRNGFTGGGFSGMVPKGFGFGGTPTWTDSVLAPLHGGSAR